MVSDSSKNKQRQAVGQILVNKQQTTDNYVIIFIINTAKYEQTVLSLRKTHPRMSVLKGHAFIGPSQAHMETRLGNITWRTGVITSFSLLFHTVRNRRNLSESSLCDQSIVKGLVVIVKIPLYNQQQ